MKDAAACEARDEVLLASVDGVATITLNRPARKNAITTASWLRLDEVVREVRENPGVRAVVLTGAGGDFCAGADLGGRPDPRHPLTRMSGFSDLAVALYEMPKPVIAKIEGVAVGAGCRIDVFLQGEEGIRVGLARVPLGRLVSWHEVVDPACYLLSDFGTYMTGTQLTIDSGRAPRYN